LATRRTPRAYATTAIAVDGETPTLTSENVVLWPEGQIKLSNGHTINVDPDGSAGVIASFQKHGALGVVDYEHQTLGGKYSSPDGKAPAAGWIKRLAYVPGRGLVAPEIEWTPAAAAMIHNREYRYLSAVSDYDKKTGRPINLHSVALTNVPATPGAQDLAAASGRFQDVEFAIMAEEPMQDTVTTPADDMAMAIGELRSALVSAGTTVEDGAGMIPIVRMAAAWIMDQNKAPGDGEDGAEDAEAVASLRRLVAAKDGTTLADLVGPIERAIVGDKNPLATQLAAANKRIESLESDRAEAEAEKLVEWAIAERKIDPEREDGPASRSWAIAKAKADPDGFRELVPLMADIGPAEGARTGGPAPKSSPRSTVIAKAAREFETDETLAVATDKRSHIEQRLRDAFGPERKKLTADEATAVGV